MSKESEAQDLPPPYTEAHAASPPASAAAAAAILNPSLYTYHLAAHLTSLPTRLRESQRARSTQQAADDLDLITHLLPHIEGFLADITARPRSPPVAELTLVPSSAVPATWTLSGAAERRREGDLVQLVRVAVPSPLHQTSKDGGSGDSKGGDGASSTAAPPTGASAYSSTTPLSGLPPERDWNAVQFDEWGRWDEDAAQAQAVAVLGEEGASALLSGSWWWRDERMARRLSTYLQPKPPVKAERRAVQAAVVQAKEEKKSSGWGWGRRRGESSSASSNSAQQQQQAPPPPPSPSPKSPGTPGLEASERVNMAVKADEVTFRRENEFGVWESMSGWAIVVTVTIRR